MSTAKLHINIHQGLIEAEGSEDFVYRVYSDFKDLIKWENSRPPLEAALVDSPDDRSSVGATKGIEVGERPKSRRRAKIVQNKESAPSITNHKPKIVSDLDTNGIKEYLSNYNVGNHANIIVAIIHFLKKKGREAVSADDIFTCYRDGGIKLPEKFGQAFIDTKNKKGYIEFAGPDLIELTIRGVNHIEHGGMKPKG